MPKIRDALLLQKEELEKRFGQTLVEREEKMLNIDNDVIKAIIGPRRAGKSFFAIHELKKYGNFAYVNFDDEVLINIDDYNEIISELNSIY